MTGVPNVAYRNLEMTMSPPIVSAISMSIIKWSDVSYQS